MPKVMTLEGARLGEIRSRLYGPQLGWWRQPVQLNGIFDPVTSHPFIALGGLALGAWLAIRKRRR